MPKNGGFLRFLHYNLKFQQSPNVLEIGQKMTHSLNVLGKIGTSKNNELPTLGKLLRALLSAGGVLLVFNEIRGLLVSIPVMLALYQSGGTLMAWWIALCSLGGIALSVIVPAWLLARVRK